MNPLVSALSPTNVEIYLLSSLLMGNTYTLHARKY